jgi:WD40 repeat protein
MKRFLVLVLFAFAQLISGLVVSGHAEELPDYVIWRYYENLPHKSAIFYNQGNNFILSTGSRLTKVDTQTGIGLDTLYLGRDTTQDSDDAHIALKMALIDENTFVTGHTKCHIKIWDINTLEVLKTIDTLNKFRYNNPAGINTLGDVYSLDVNPERNLIVAWTGSSFFLYDYAKDSIIILDIDYDFDIPGRKLGPAKFTPNMQEIVYEYNNELVFMDLNTLEQTRSISLSNETIIVDIEFSPDGRYMAYSKRNSSIDPDGHDIEVLELSTLKTVYIIDAYASEIEFWDNQFLVISSRPFEIHDVIKKEKVADFGQFEPDPLGDKLLERHPSGDYLLS